MDRSGLLELASYHAYANQLVLDVVGRMREEELDRAISPSHGTARQLLRHLLQSDAFFLSLCEGSSPSELSERPDVAEFLKINEASTKGLRAFLEFLDDDSALERQIPFALMKQAHTFTVWQLLTQAFLHASHHRGELSIVLSELGYPLPTLDIILKFAKNER